MTTSHLKTGEELTLEILCISNIHQTSDNVQHNICIMNQLLSHLQRIINAQPVNF